MGLFLNLDIQLELNGYDRLRDIMFIIYSRA
nr:MAG TPA: hypothetical protein [Caudoviricetes sp.]DAI98751.1 MAG TPA: hypothetical protein [Caudoviricetes sp.]